MKKLNRKVLLLLAAAFLLANVTVVYAYTRHTTDVLTNTLLPAVVDAEVAEAFDGSSKTSIQLQNTGNIDAYLRMKVITYWQDSKGNPIAKPVENFSISYDQTNWVEHNGIYYYKSPVAPNALTREFLTSSITLTTDSENVNGVEYTYHQVVEIIPEAIQSKPAEAVESSWDVTVNTDGTIG